MAINALQMLQFIENKKQQELNNQYRKQQMDFQQLRYAELLKQAQFEEQQRTGEGVYSQMLPSLMAPNMAGANAGKQPTRQEVLSDVGGLLRDYNLDPKKGFDIASEMYDNIYPESKSKAQGLRRLLPLTNIQLPGDDTIYDALADPESGDIVQKYRSAPSATSSMYASQRRYKNIEALRKEFQDTPTYKDYTTITKQHGRAEAAMAELSNDPKNNVAIDQTLITVLNKMLDENSVVRESEYARTPENIAFINRVNGSLKKLVEGGAGLTNKDRQAIKDMIDNFKDIAEQRFGAEQKYYTDIAEVHGFNPYEVTRVERSPKSRKATPVASFSDSDLDDALKQSNGDIDAAMKLLMGGE